MQSGRNMLEMHSMAVNPRMRVLVSTIITTSHEASMALGHSLLCCLEFSTEPRRTRLVGIS